VHQDFLEELEFLGLMERPDQQVLLEQQGQMEELEVQDYQVLLVLQEQPDQVELQDLRALLDQVDKQVRKEPPVPQGAQDQRDH